MLTVIFTIATVEAQAKNAVVRDTSNSNAHPIRGVLSVYPDPATGNINIKWENQPKGTANVVISDTADKEVFTTILKLTTPSGQTQIDLSSLKQGDYTITINSEKISFTGKLSVVP